MAKEIGETCPTSSSYRDTKQKTLNLVQVSISQHFENSNYNISYSGIALTQTFWLKLSDDTKH